MGGPDRLGLGVDLMYHNFHMGHTITAESLGVIKEWLDKQL
jgi:predicted esterase